MQITLTKEQVREAFGELRYMGADYCYKYDKETRKKTEEVEALKLHLGSMKLGNSVDIRLEATELPKVEPYTVVELEEAVYAPYVQRGNFPVLVDRISCKGSPCTERSVQIGQGLKRKSITAGNYAEKKRNLQRAVLLQRRNVYKR